MVDDEDYEYLCNHTWCYHIEGYAQSRINKNLILMHRFILNLNDTKILIDHIDGNKLNNQKSNLRLSTPSTNQINRSIPKQNTSGYKGVCKIPNSEKWRARIMYKGKLHCLGSYIKKEDAAKAYNEAALKYFGDFAWLNKINN